MNGYITDKTSRLTSSGRPRLLMLTHRLPYPPDKGERIRAWHMLRHLSRSFEVHLASLVDEPVAASSWQALSHHAKQVGLFPVGSFRQTISGIGSALSGRSLSEGMFYDAILHRTIRAWHQRYHFDAALAVCSSMAGYLDDLRIERKVIDLVDVDSIKWAQYAEDERSWKRWVYRFESRRLKQCEAQLADHFDHVVLTTEDEARLYRDIAPHPSVHAVPNGVDLDYFQPQPLTRTRPIALFTGALDYRPNVDGVEWLAKQVWPKVREQLGHAELHIVGRRPSARIHALAKIDGVQIVGPVDDVRPHLAEATVCVAPLQVARGVQNKVLEAMAMAKPVLATSGAATGIEAEHKRHLIIADTTQQWVEQLSQMFTSEQLTRGIGSDARALVETTRQWDRCLRGLKRLLLEEAETLRGSTANTAA